MTSRGIGEFPFCYACWAKQLGYPTSTHGRNDLEDGRSDRPNPVDGVQRRQNGTYPS